MSDDKPPRTPTPITFAYVLSMSAVAFAGYASRNKLPPFDYRDGIAFAVLFALLYWCLSERVDADAEGHEGARNGFAFRCGKALKRILHNGRRNAATRD